MSNLYVYRYLRELRNADRKGVAVDVISFLFFWFMWSLGYVFGLSLVLLGVRLGDYFQIRNDIDDEMIARMNDEGPNN
jgi:hypothetical protein